MKTGSKAEPPNAPAPAESLANVLEQSEHVTEMVKESAEELSSVNTVLKRRLADRDPPPGVESALKRNEDVEDRVQEASEQLSAVTRALEGQVRDRRMLDHQYAAVMEQGEAARHAAFHDKLTGLPNRALFNDRLEHGLAQATRHGWSLAVMFLDLDDFKIINDTHGHEAGDCVLRTIATRLANNTRGDDSICRNGGDEFLYLLMETADERTIASIAEKLISALGVPCPVSVRGLQVSPSVRASIGIAIFPRDGATADALIASADAAMYRAKQEKCGYAFVPQA